MNKKILLLISCIGFITLSDCSHKKTEYNANCLSSDEQLAFLNTMVRYSSKLAPEANHQNKFNPEFNWYYDRAIGECKILYCFKEEKDSVYQLMVARQARSLTPMEEGIAVRVKFDQQGGFASYEEVFRTWKMPADSLQKRGKFLFEKMVKGEDLTLYYSKFQKDRFIEFPNDRFSFDKENRRWIDAELDTLVLE